MNKHDNALSLALGGPGFVFQCIGSIQDNLLVLILGTLMLLVGLGLYARAKGRSPVWCLLGFLSLIGLIILYYLEDRTLTRAGSVTKRTPAGAATRSHSRPVPPPSTDLALLGDDLADQPKSDSTRRALHHSRSGADQSTRAPRDSRRAKDERALDELDEADPVFQPEVVLDVVAPTDQVCALVYGTMWFVLAVIIEATPLDGTNLTNLSDMALFLLGGGFIALMSGQELRQKRQAAGIEVAYYPGLWWTTVVVSLLGALSAVVALGSTVGPRGAFEALVGAVGLLLGNYLRNRPMSRGSKVPANDWTVGCGWYLYGIGMLCILHLMREPLQRFAPGWSRRDAIGNHADLMREPLQRYAPGLGGRTP